MKAGSYTEKTCLYKATVVFISCNMYAALMQEACCDFGRWWLHNYFKAFLGLIYRLWGCIICCCFHILISSNVPVLPAPIKSVLSGILRHFYGWFQLFQQTKWVAASDRFALYGCEEDSDEACVSRGETFCTRLMCSANTYHIWRVLLIALVRY